MKLECWTRGWALIGMLKRHDVHFLITYGWALILRLGLWMAKQIRQYHFVHSAGGKAWEPLSTLTSSVGCVRCYTHHLMSLGTRTWSSGGPRICALNLSCGHLGTAHSSLCLSHKSIWAFYCHVYKLYWHFYLTLYYFEPATAAWHSVQHKAMLHYWYTLLMYSFV